MFKQDRSALAIVLSIVALFLVVFVLLMYEIATRFAHVPPQLTAAPTEAPGTPVMAYVAVPLPKASDNLIFARLTLPVAPANRHWYANLVLVTSYDGAG